MATEVFEELRCQHAAWQARELDARAAFETERAANKLAQQQKEGLHVELATLKAAFQQGHIQALQQAEAAQAHAACLKQHVDLQEQHAQHQEHCHKLEQQLHASQQECKALQQQLDNDTASHQDQVAKLQKQHQEEVASLNKGCELRAFVDRFISKNPNDSSLRLVRRADTERLAHVESFKNPALASKRAVEEQLNKDRASFEGTLARLEAEVSRRTGAEEALKSRLLALRAELDATRRERDMLRTQPQLQQNTAAMGLGAATGMGAGQQSSTAMLGGMAGGMLQGSSMRPPVGMGVGGAVGMGSGGAMGGGGGNGGGAGVGQHQPGLAGNAMQGSVRQGLPLAGRQLGGTVRGRGRK